MQRVCDIIFSISACILLLPFAIPIVLILALTGEHEIFYAQSRVGENGKEFPLLKFATMLKNSPSMGTGEITIKNDPRVLPFGRILRSTKVNELPQLLNILFGQMSFVGPRPLTPKHFNFYSEHEKSIVASMKPGLTGVGSIVFRDEEGILDRFVKGPEKAEYYRTVITPYKAELEGWYKERRSLGLYFKIIAATACAVLNVPSNVYLSWFTDLPAPPASLTGNPVSG